MNNLKHLVIKRDGAKSPFNSQSIFNAVKSAIGNEIEDYPNLASLVSTIVTSTISGTAETKISTIQDMVEEILMENAPKIARKYIEYRHDRDVCREKTSALNSEIQGLIEQSNADLLNENANKDGKVIPTQRDLLAGIVSKHYAKQHILPRRIVEAHESGDIHYHDMDYAPFFPMFNCMIIDLKNMLTNGFKMGNAEIGTPKSIQTAASVTAQIIAQVSSHIYGGTTINRIDEILAPYVTATYNKNLQLAKEWGIKDSVAFAESRTEKECYDAFQSLEYEINTLHTANGQTPFVSIGYGLGKSYEERLIQQSIMKVRIKGLGENSKTAVFPKLLFAIKEGLNRSPSDPNYDIKQLALECASKRMYPDILNYEQVVEKTGSFKTPMGCRSFLERYTDEHGNEIHEGRNNLGVVSINLPRIAIKSNGDEKLFYSLLDDMLSIAKKALDTRIERLKSVKASVAPVLYCEGACGVRLKPDDYVIDLFKNGRASISLGYIGIHETVNALYGVDEHTFDSDIRQLKAKAIVAKLKETVNKWREDSEWSYSLYATPSENLCSRFCQIDSKSFGIIKGVTDKGYYTNSFHLDVEKKTNPYFKINFEMDYPALSSGGFICYGEFPNMQNNLEALEDVWDYSYNRVPYYGTNTPIDECYKCGYHGEFEAKSKGFTCPKCGNHEDGQISVTRRVCGYLGSPDARPFNSGKQEEVQRRVKHL